MPRTYVIGRLATQARLMSNRVGRSRPHRVLTESSRAPDPKSRARYTRLIGYSAGAGFGLAVIVDPEDFSGVTAWKTRGADLRDYLESKEAGS